MNLEDMRQTFGINDKTKSLSTSGGTSGLDVIMEYNREVQEDEWNEILDDCLGYLYSLAKQK